MLQPQQIREFCERRYPVFLRSVVTGEGFFPLEVPFGRPRAREDHNSLSRQITALASSDLEFNIEWTVRRFRLTGEQRVPCRIWFDSAETYLGCLRKQKEFARFLRNIQTTRDLCPRLMPWIAEHPQKVVSNEDIWADLLEVVRYFLENPRPGLYARELPIKVGSKFIEENRAILDSILRQVLDIHCVAQNEVSFERRYGLRCDEATVRFRILDDTLQNRLGIPFADVSVPVSTAEGLPWRDVTVIVVENKLTFLTLPLLSNSIGIWGGGGAAQLLASFRWLERCKVIYWGDIDTHGFHIVSRLRSKLPHLETVMMNSETLERFAPLAVSGRAAAYEDTIMLTAPEHEAYVRVRADQLLLEQEKIPHIHAVARLKQAAVSRRSAEALT